MLNQVPQPAQTLQETQNPILTNFTSIDTAFTVNHVQINDGSGNQGKHKFVEFVQQSGDIVPAATEINMYNLAVGSPAINELFIYKSNLAASYPITQLAKGAATGTGNDRGWTCLPSGLVMKFQQGTTSGTSGNVNINTDIPTPPMPTISTVLFAIVIPRGSTPFSYVITSISGPVIQFTTSISSANYTIVAWGM